MVPYENGILVPYEVMAGDTLSAISLRHGVTVDTLRDLNKGTLNPPSGDVIQVGQIIYVPANKVHVLPELGSNKKGDGSNDKTEAFIAEQAKRIGQTYGQDSEAEQRVLGLNGDTRFGKGENYRNSPSLMEHEKQYLKQQVKSAFEGEANERANSLMGGLGTARVKLGFDDDFSLKRYEADVLAPLMDNGERMLFVQAGGRYDDNSNRTIFNLGVGQRHFFDEWMLGYNGFFDYDVTRSHSRLGLGGEAWADFLKLSANVYTPLSGWKDSRDFDEYLERAARGFDLNAKYYLPQYPQVGLSAKLEQYFGDEVDLLGSKKLERNPYAGTVGLEWQPVPLFKVGVDHREAKGNQSDTQFKVGLEWKLGATLDEMLNAGKVAGSRQLQGMRHDLVERNNNIVLEYKEKQRSASVEHAPLRGVSGDLITLNPAVSLSNGQVVSWRWSAADPLLQGALSDANIQSPTLTLPVLPPEVLLDKEFALFLTVTDERGRSYQSSAIPVVVQVNPDQLRHRLVVVAEGQSIADSHAAPEAEIAVDDAGTTIEFVLVRQLKDDSSAYAIEQAQEVVFDQLTGFQVEQLEGELRSRSGARNGKAADEQVWVNKLKVTPRNPGQPLPAELLSFSAKGSAGETGRVNITLSTANAIDLEQAPLVSDLRLAGKLEVGQTLSATYRFDAQGGDRNDHSTYVWGNQGETAARVADGQRVAESGQILPLSLTTAEVGEIIELSLQAKNGLAVTGNTLTVDSSMSIGDGNETEGGPTVVDPHNYRVELRYDSSATLEDNGVNGERPVANQDKITAFCQMEGQAEFSECDEERYALRWLTRDQNGAEQEIKDASSSTYTASGADQGKRVLVEAALRQQ
ncbi:inverse autotransporter beta domain-containing protein [Aeromonas veronii]